MLTNLISNAVKFTQEDKICIRVALEPGGADKWMLCFSVTDTGIGMNTKSRQSLFTAFTQADGSTTRHILVEFLRSFGLSARAFESIEHALTEKKNLQKTLFFLTIMDTDLPKKDLALGMEMLGTFVPESVPCIAIGAFTRKNTADGLAGARKREGC